MKKLFGTLSFLLIISLSFSQNTDQFKLRAADMQEFVSKNQYKFPTYTRAKIVFRNGDSAFARLNFNNFTQVVKYIDGLGQVVDLTNQADISFIATGTDTIFCETGYYQWVASSSTAKLAAISNYKVVSRASIGAFGTASPAKNVIQVSQVVSGTNIYQLEANEELTIAKVTTYYISVINGLKNNFVPVNKKNLQKLFPKKDVENFLKDNRVNLNKEQDLVDLMVFLAK